MSNGERTTAFAWRKQAPDRVCPLAMPLRRPYTNACANEGGGATPAQSVRRKRLQSGESQGAARPLTASRSSTIAMPSAGHRLRRRAAGDGAAEPRRMAHGRRLEGLLCRASGTSGGPESPRPESRREIPLARWLASSCKRDPTLMRALATSTSRDRTSSQRDACMWTARLRLCRSVVKR